MEIDEFYREWLTSSGFVESKSTHNFSPAGKVYLAPKGVACGYYWVYGEKDLFDIKIHDFYFFEDHLISLTTPECLSITYYDSVSGEELTPYRRLTAGCVKTFHGGHEVYQSMMHKNIPIRSVGIEVFPAYYEKYLRESYPNDYVPPQKAYLQSCFMRPRLRKQSLLFMNVERTAKMIAAEEYLSRTWMP